MICCLPGVWVVSSDALPAASGPVLPPPQLPPPWVLRPLPESTLPVVETSYPMFWRTPAWRGWKPVVALVLGVLGALFLMVVFPLAGIAIDVASGRASLEEITDAAQRGTLITTPGLFLANNVGIALGLPLAFLVARFFRQPGGYLSSVAGRFRWRWFGLCVGVLLPVWLVSVGIESWLQWRSRELTFAVNPDTWLLALGILVTTPFQCAGEEYLDRGVINRGVASFFTSQRIGAVVGAMVSAGVFMFAHNAADWWLNSFYFIFGLTACWLTWRTGGLEAAVAMHLVNNMTAEASMPFTDISGMFDRGAGAGSPSMFLTAVVVPLIGAGLVELLVRRRHPQATAAPAGQPAITRQAGRAVPQVDAVES